MNRAKNQIASCIKTAEASGGVGFKYFGYYYWEHTPTVSCLKAGVS